MNGQKSAFKTPEQMTASSSIISINNTDVKPPPKPVVVRSLLVNPLAEPFIVDDDMEHLMDAGLAPPQPQLITQVSDDIISSNEAAQEPETDIVELLDSTEDYHSLQIGNNNATHDQAQKGTDGDFLSAVANTSNTSPLQQQQTMLHGLSPPTQHPPPTPPPPPPPPPPSHALPPPPVYLDAQKYTNGK
jgi:hypothetical protein